MRGFLKIDNRKITPKSSGLANPTLFPKNNWKWATIYQTIDISSSAQKYHYTSPFLRTVQREVATSMIKWAVFSVTTCLTFSFSWCKLVDVSSYLCLHQISSRPCNATNVSEDKSSQRQDDLISNFSHISDETTNWKLRPHTFRLLSFSLANLYK